MLVSEEKNQREKTHWYNKVVSVWLLCIYYTKTGLKWHKWLAHQCWKRVHPAGLRWRCNRHWLKSCCLKPGEQRETYTGKGNIFIWPQHLIKDCLLTILYTTNCFFHIEISKIILQRGFCHKLHWIKKKVRRYKNIYKSRWLRRWHSSRLINHLVLALEAAVACSHSSQLCIPWILQLK